MGNIIKTGERVALILKLDTKKRICYFLGYGVYDGEYIPELDLTNKKTERITTKTNQESCRFTLDTGEVFYDYFVWFMEEDRFNKVFLNDCYEEKWKVKLCNKYGKTININKESL